MWRRKKKVKIMTTGAVEIYIGDSWIVGRWPINEKDIEKYFKPIKEKNASVAISFKW
jgi:hypothetical protein